MIRWPRFGNQDASAENIETIERQTNNKIRSFLDQKDRKTGQTLVRAIVTRSNHAIKDGDIDKDYESTQLDTHGGDIGGGKFTSITPRLSFHREGHRGSNPVTLKFSRFMDDSSAYKTSEKLWKDIPDPRKKALLLKAADEAIEKRNASKAGALREGLKDNSDEFYYYQDELTILFLTVYKNALRSDEFKFQYGIDGDLSVTLTGSALDLAAEIQKAYFTCGMDPEEYEGRHDTRKPALKQIFEDVKLKLKL